MLNIRCIDNQKYIRTFVDQHNYNLAICTICGLLSIDNPQNGPEEAKFVHYICHHCLLNKKFPKNVRMKRRFVQYLDDNKNLLKEKETGPWPD